MINPRIAFFGNTKYSVIDARVLHEKLGLVLVVTKPDKPSGRNRILTPNPVKTFAVDNKIPVIEADSFSDTSKQKLEEIFRFAQDDGGLDFIVVADYGVILPKTALEIPKIAPLNIHQSLLPKYRGTSPAPAAILAGDKKTGVTIIKMVEAVDAGDILAQEEYEMTPAETTNSLLTKLNQLGSQLVCKVIENYDDIKPKPQDESKVIFSERMSKTDGLIDLLNPPDPATLNRMIRAYYPWPTVWTKLDGKILKFLPNQMVQPEGKKPMTVKEFLNGYPQAKPLLEKLLTS
jgi:methionyl-tRNA formyltransferase